MTAWISTPAWSRAATSRSALCGGERDRLLAQHVLAGRCRLDRERHVQMVGQRIVHRLDLGIAQQLGVGAVGARYAERLRAPPGRASDRATRSRSGSALCCIAGITFWSAILAVPITPKRTGSIGRFPLVTLRPLAIPAAGADDTSQVTKTKGSSRRALCLRQSVTLGLKCDRKFGHDIPAGRPIVSPGTHPPRLGDASEEALHARDSASTDGRSDVAVRRRGVGAGRTWCGAPCRGS